MSEKLSEETLQAIEDCGAAEMSPNDCCAIAEISEEAFWGDETAQKRYRMGQLRTKLAIRQTIIKMAKGGIPQMVKAYQDFTAENERDFMPPLVELDKDDAQEREEFAEI